VTSFQAEKAQQKRKKNNKVKNFLLPVFAFLEIEDKTD
jgi:hypothetical protein